MKSKKAHSAGARFESATAAASATLPLTPIGGADPLPTAGAPTPPVVDSPVVVDARKGTRVLQSEVDVAENAAKELRASTTFSELLSARLGTAEAIANALDFSVSWYREAKAGTTWDAYARKQSNLSWDYTLAMIDRLRAGFQAVAATDPSVEKELVNFTKLLNARKVVAAKAVVTKQRIKSGELVVNKAAKAPRKGTKISTKATGTATANAPAPPAATEANVNGVEPVANAAVVNAAH